MVEHPSKDIVGSEGSELAGKKIALCITGSVAAYKSPDLARELMRLGAEVFCVMTQAAQKIIHPYLMEWATGNPVVTELTGGLEHVALAGEHEERVDLVLVAPATANTISKAACGIGDTSVTSVISTAMGAGIPIIVVPAMHESMYKHPAVAENLRKLREMGVYVVEPVIEEKKAKLPDVQDVVDEVVNVLSPKDMQGMKVLVTAGPTYEPIDPVRIITNRSSGKMGIAIAREARRRGAEVTLVCGPTDVRIPRGIKTIWVETTQQLFDAVVTELKSSAYDVVAAAAAAADYTPEKAFGYKVPTREHPSLEIKLTSTPKVIDTVKEVSPSSFLIAFRAEYGVSDEELIQSAIKRMKTANADMIVVNDVGRPNVGFRYDTNEVFVIDKDENVVHIPLTSKKEVAKRVMDMALARMGRAVFAQQ